MNIHLILQMAADAMGDRQALTYDGRSLSYAELDQTARRVAAKIGGFERLGWLAENHPAMPASLFGAALAGKPFVPINYRLAADRIEALKTRIAPALLVGEDLAATDGIETISREQAIEGDLFEEDANPDPGVAIELFTSGTTGEPKSALLRHANLMAYILGSVEFMGAGEDEATLITVPPYHVAGIAAVLSSTYAGRRMVQLPAFTPASWIETARAENVTNVFLVPTMLQQIVEHAPDDLNLPSLRAISYGGGKMPLAVIERAMQLFPNCDFTNAYGLTETSSTICLLDADAHREARDSDDPLVRRRLASVGRALPTIEIAIRSEDGAECGPDEVGQVFARGDQIGGEYKGLGSQLDADGWFPTRDVGFLDSEGYLFLDGRADDVIVRGGENISPGEVEDVLLTHPAVSECAVVAVSDEQWGEAVGAVVICKDAPPHEEELQEHVRASLRSSRVPSKVLFVNELPYNETGKLLRRVLRDQIDSA